MFMNKLHREDGPAYQEWTSDGKIAVEKYFVNGEYHRIDGPAIKMFFSNGKIKNKQYWVNGCRLKEEWFTQFNKDISKDFANENVRNMLINIFSRY